MQFKNRPWRILATIQSKLQGKKFLMALSNNLTACKGSKEIHVKGTFRYVLKPGVSEM
jgi:hypothetical protein